MSMWDSVKQWGSSAGSFGRYTADKVNPAGIVGGVAGGVGNVGTRFADSVNRFLTGKHADGSTSSLGFVVRAGLAVGAIYMGGKLIGNFLDRLRTKNATKAIKEETETLQLRTQAAQMNAMAEYINVTGQIPQMENPYAQGGNVARFAPNGPKSNVELAQNGYMMSDGRPLN